MFFNHLHLSLSDVKNIYISNLIFPIAVIKCLIKKVVNNSNQYK